MQLLAWDPKTYSSQVTIQPFWNVLLLTFFFCHFECVGGHTIGVAHCSTIKSRLYNFAPSGSPELNSSYLAKLQEICPQHSNVDRVIGLDLRTPIRFDNSYFINLVQNKGLLISDQDLFSAPDSLTVDLVKIYSSNQKIFFDHFAHSMIKMGNINPLTGNDGEIRSNCRKPNSAN